MNKRQTIIISCGGTGGHIFPGLEIARSIQSIDSSLDILFVGAKNKMEMREVPRAGFPIVGLWIQGINRKLYFNNILFPIKILISIIHSIFLISWHRPIVVVGTGGFASGPIVFIASLLRVPTYIQEQNCVAGLTNKVLGNFVDKVFVAYDGMTKFFPDYKVLKLGNPVRQSLKTLFKDKTKAMSMFDLKQDMLTVLILGGSLGAEPINKVIVKCLDTLSNHNIQLIWQTGKSHYMKYEHLKSDKCSIYKFIHNMDMAYLAADIVISRAGAIAISEICFLSKVSILIPSPYVTDNHQYANAKYLLNHNACIMLEEKELDESLIDSVILLKNNQKRQEISKEANKLFNYNAASKISNIIVNDIL
tara:strand:+ start:667 stop:1755 length:1089 start_codon:yes stop_codon:yes gene_type:complete